ncbi:MAG TPA: Gfo/Idh/MocA family oxidoreductase [Clostridia bacterium]|nr:Gfo/Idh/MocA family oxidoreductase [Clostridia bacterium]
MKPFRIAQIGTSRWSHGNECFRALKNNPDVFEIAGYCFPENEQEKFPKQMNIFEGYRELTLDEILNDPTIVAVAIETEEKYLTKYALSVVRHGKHIHMEKPGGLDSAEFEQVATIAKTNQTVFHTGYMYRYNPYVQELLEQIKCGELGEIISVEAQMNCYEPLECRKWLEDYPGGMMFFLGCHLIDLIYTIQGRPKAIIPLNKSTGLDGVTCKDFGMVIFEYDKGVSFAKTSAVEGGGFERRQLVVCGSKKTVELHPLERHIENRLLTTGRYTRENSTLWNTVHEQEFAKPFDRYSPMMLSFAQMVRGEKKNPYNYDYELTLHQLVIKASGG